MLTTISNDWTQIEQPYLLPQQKIPIDETKFFHVGKGLKNKKKKSKQCFMIDQNCSNS
jgi:hypothetical protein